MSDPTRQPDAAPAPDPVAPFCFNCGYDLTGLELPRPCPECGRVADPVAEVAEARRWFAEEAWKPWKILWPSRIPIAIWHALNDQQSRRIARRRRRLLIWLPALLGLLLVFSANSFTAHGVGTLELGSATMRRVEQRFLSSVEWQTRLYGDEFAYSLGFRGVGPDTHYVINIERPVMWDFRPTPFLGPDVLQYAFAPWLISVLPLTTGCLIMRIATWQRKLVQRQNALVATATLAPMYGLFHWASLILIGIMGSFYLQVVSGRALWGLVLDRAVFWYAIPWLCAFSVAWLVLLSRERSHRLFPRRKFIVPVILAVLFVPPWLAAGWIRQLGFWLMFR